MLPATLPLPASLAPDVNAQARSQIAAFDRLKSVAQARSAYEDNAAFTENWANMSNWTMPATPGMQVSAGATFSVGTQGAGSGGNHSYVVGSTASFRAVFVYNHVVGGSSGGVIVGVSKDTAGAIPASAGANARGLFFSGSVTTPQSWDGTGTNISGAPAMVTGQYVVTVEADANFLAVAARLVGAAASSEIRFRWARGGFAINNLYLFNSDSRALTGPNVGLLGVRNGFGTIAPRTGIEGVGETVHWSGDGTNNYKVILPPGYDSRIPSPVAICWHGNGSDENLYSDNTNSKLITKALLNDGYIVVTASYPAGSSTWGAQAGLDAYYAAYKYVRDNFAIGPVVFVGTSMGGIESLLGIAQGKIPEVAAWVGISPTTNLLDNYNNATFTGIINGAYGISGNYAAKTAGHDPMLLTPYAFKGVPMMFLAASDDVTVSPANNTTLFSIMVLPFAREINVVAGITGGHSFNPAPYTGQITTFLDKYIRG